MFQFPGFASYVYTFNARSLVRVGFPHSDIPGSKLVYQLPWAFRRLPRPSSPLDAKSSAVCPSWFDHTYPPPSGLPNAAGQVMGSAPRSRSTGRGRVGLWPARRFWLHEITRQFRFPPPKTVDQGPEGSRPRWPRPEKGAGLARHHPLVKVAHQLPGSPVGRFCLG